MNFLNDDDRVYTYKDLTDSIASNSFYVEYFISNNLFDFFSNIIKALYTDSPIVLLDEKIDISLSSQIDSNKINKATIIQIDSKVSINEILEKVKKSKSKITIFTSGTTGRPKKISHDVRNLISNVRFNNLNNNVTWGLAYNKSHIAALQVFLQAFCNLSYIINLFQKPKNIILDKMLSKDITHISATPTFYRMLFPCEYIYVHVQRISIGGEKPSEELFKKLSYIFPNAKINNIYASTETGTLFVSNNDIFTVPDIISHLIRFENNELLIHYSLLGDFNDFKLQNDFYRTGDLVEFLDLDCTKFKFVSRNSNQINVGGYKVNPEEVENILETINGVNNAYVYGIDNPVTGKLLCADLIISKGFNINEVEIKNSLKSLLSDYKIPRRIKFVNNFNFTKTGKLKR